VLKVVVNTYPNVDLRAGDEVEWRLMRGAFWLHRKGAGIYDRPAFAGPEVDKNGMKRSNGKEPVLVGVVAEVKSRGYRLVLSEV